MEGMISSSSLCVSVQARYRKWGKYMAIPFHHFTVFGFFMPFLSSYEYS